MSSFAELLNPVHSPEKTKILEAIAVRGPRIVPVDIAADTGMALPVVVSELNNIASETHAHLEVTESGNIAYKFSPNLQQQYVANASRQMFRSAFRVVSNVALIVMRAFVAAMFFLVRISFGVALVAGAILVVVLVVVVIIAGLKALTGGDGDSGGDGFDFDFGSLFDFGFAGDRPFYMYWAFDWLWDWFFFWRYIFPPYGGYQSGYNAPYDAQNDYLNKNQSEKKSNFLFNVYSYLFGDGNPNPNFEERKWQTVAQVLESNAGVVTAEQMAPYTGQDPKNEDWMIGIMQRFNGSPEVTESGNIIYTFPAFQSAVQLGDGAGSSTALEPAEQDNFAPENLSKLFNQHVGRQKAMKNIQRRSTVSEGYLAEQEWPFMTVDGGGLTSIIIFALVVLVGSVVLIFNMNWLPFLHKLQPLLYLLFGYGLMFFLIPALRFPIFRMINDGIIERNDAKMAYATQLKNPTPALNDKLLEARYVRFNGLPKAVDKTVYTTEKDALDQPDDLDKKFEQF